MVLDMYWSAAIGGEENIPISCIIIETEAGDPLINFLSHVRNRGGQRGPDPDL